MNQSPFRERLGAVLAARSDGRGPVEYPRWLRYGCAVVASVLAVAITLLSHDFFAPNTFYLVWPIVMLCAWFGGPGPGVLSTVISLLLLHYLSLSPNGSFQLTLDFLARAIIMIGATCLAGLASQAWMHMAKALNASRQQTLDILEGITDPFYGLNNDWRFTYVNDAAVQQWGRSREKLMGAHIWQEFPKGRETEAYQVMYRAKREQRPQRFETFSAFLNRWVEVNVYPTARGLSVYFRSIDERKRAEQALRESQHFLEQVANASPNAIYIYDMEQQLNVYANQQMFAMLGYPPEQLRERGRALIVESVHPDDRSMVLDYAGRFAGVQDGEMVTYEFRVQDTGGTWHWLSTRETVFNRTVDGRVRQVVGAAQDISERKLAEQRAAILQEITNQFSEAATPRQIGDAIVQGSVAALGGHAGGMALLSEDGKAIVPVSEYGFAPDTLELFSRTSLDRHIPSVDAVRTGKPIWIRTLDEYLAGYPELKEALAANGSQSNASLPLVAGGRVIGVFGISFARPNSFAPVDRALLLTLAQQCAQAIDRARLYEAEKKARKAAEEADRLKMQFLGMISHELRTPLTSIKGFTTTLLAEDVTFDPSEQRQFLHIVDQEADKLTDLVDQLLDLSRLQAGKLRIQSQPSTLGVIFDNAAVQLQSLTINHRLEIHTDENLPPVLADQQRIAQVLVNLVNNAAKFSPPGSPITMTARVCGGEVQIDVGDQGVGIPPEARPLVFEAFRQVERKENTSSRGAGLGLAICKGILEAHGQRIWISDNTPQGTVISFTLAVA